MFHLGPYACGCYPMSKRRDNTNGSMFLLSNVAAAPARPVSPPYLSSCPRPQRAPRSSADLPVVAVFVFVVVFASRRPACSSGSPFRHCVAFGASLKWHFVTRFCNRFGSRNERGILDFGLDFGLFRPYSSAPVPSIGTVLVTGSQFGVYSRPARACALSHRPHTRHRHGGDGETGRRETGRRGDGKTGRRRVPSSSQCPHSASAD